MAKGYSAQAATPSVAQSAKAIPISRPSPHDLKEGRRAAMSAGHRIAAALVPVSNIDIFVSRGGAIADPSENEGSD